MEVGTLAGTVTSGHAHRASVGVASHLPATRDSVSSSVSRAPSPRITARKTDPIPHAESFQRIRFSPATSPIPSRSSSPLLGGSSGGGSTPLLRASTSSSSWFLRPTAAVQAPDMTALARRVSMSLHEYAHAAARPSTYIHFVRSLHPSLLALFVVAVTATLSNKSLLLGFFHGLTYSLTSWQMLCATGGTVLAQRMGAYRPQRIATKHNRELHVIAFVSSCEILCSALALRLIPVPFHVSLRAASPILTLVLSVAFLHERATLRSSSALLAVLLGVGLTSHNEDYLSLGSLLLIASAVLLSAKSLLLTYYLQARLNLHPLDCLARMSPLSAVHCLVFAFANGEPRRLWRFVQGQEFTRAHVAQVALNGVLSFAAVALALVAEKKTRAPAMAITTHAAQATTILSSVLLFGLRLSPVNFAGVAVTLGGGVLYALWDARDKERDAWLHYAAGGQGGGGFGLGLGFDGGGGGGGGARSGDGEGLPTRAPLPPPPTPLSVQKPD
ncbi:hypothetical protein JCM8208_000060 [Rhodotorula glutinis]